MDYLAPFLAQIGDPSHLSRAEAYKLKEECLQDLKQRLIDRANLIQARFEKVRTTKNGTLDPACQGLKILEKADLRYGFRKRKSYSTSKLGINKIKYQ